MADHSCYVFSCVCGKEYRVRREGTFRCECGRLLVLDWSASREHSQIGERKEPANVEM